MTGALGLVAGALTFLWLAAADVFRDRVRALRAWRAPARRARAALNAISGVRSALLIPIAFEAFRQLGALNGVWLAILTGVGVLGMVGGAVFSFLLAVGWTRRVGRWQVGSFGLEVLWVAGLSEASLRLESLPSLLGWLGLVAAASILAAGIALARVVPRVTRTRTMERRDQIGALIGGASVWIAVLALPAWLIWLGFEL